MLFDAKDIGEPGFITRARTLTILLLYRCFDRTAMIRPGNGGAPAASSRYLCTTVSCVLAAVSRSHASCVLSLPRYSWLTRYFLSLARRTLSLACRFVSLTCMLRPLAPRAASSYSCLLLCRWAPDNIACFGSRSSPPYHCIQQSPVLYVVANILNARDLPS